MSNYKFTPGDSTPHFVVRSTNSQNFHFDTVAGRYVVLCFFGSTENKAAADAINHLMTRRDFFNDDMASLFGVSIDPNDAKSGRISHQPPGVRHFLDYDYRISRIFGAMDLLPDNMRVYKPATFILSPALKVMHVIPINGGRHNEEFDAIINNLPGVDDYAGVPLHAPVMIVPSVFEKEFCKELIAIYDKHGGGESGFMREINGETVGVFDHSFKRRKDREIEDKEIKDQIRNKLGRRLFPEINKAFNFKVTRMERYIVSCYESAERGFFRAHRDNTTKGTEHRKFAVTLNLNTEDYEGGGLCFPEFGKRTYRAPTGGAVVFGCGLLHEAKPVISGKRYAFLPFLYDEEAAQVRRQNFEFLSGKEINYNK